MKRIIFIISLVIVSLILVLFILKKEDNNIELNNNNNKILNPMWKKYMSLSDEEKSTWEVIPSQYIYTRRKIENNENIGSLIEGLEENYLPSYYSLKDENLLTPVKDQHPLGLCWAFSVSGAIESALLKKGYSEYNNPILISERQLDYATSDRGIIEGYSPYSYSRNFTGGGSLERTYELLSSGVSPVTYDIFGNYVSGITKKSLNEVLNNNNVEYTVDGYEVIGDVNYSDSTQEDNQSAVEAIKKHVYNYGAVSFAMIFGPINADRNGNNRCVYVDDDNNYLVNTQGYTERCRVSNNGSHAVLIVGWDDNFSYDYCINNDWKQYTSNNGSCNGHDINVSGTGAFIVKNSYGEDTPYFYLSYNSYMEEVYGLTSIQEKNWDNNYDFNKIYYSDYKNKESIASFYKNSNSNEKLKKISFFTDKDSTYNIYVSNDNKNYVKLTNITTNYIGRFSVNVDSTLTGPSFSIKITSNNGYVKDIYAFTSYLDNSEEAVVETNITKDKIYAYENSIEIDTSTRNIQTGQEINYKLLTEDYTDLSSNITIEQNYVINNGLKAKVTFNDLLPIGSLIIQTIYNNQVVDSDKITVSHPKSYWSSGDGSVDNPYIINNYEEFIKIGTNEYYMSLNYKLGHDIDFSNKNFSSIGANALRMYDTSHGEWFEDIDFTGSLDGDNHELYGLSCSNENCSLFKKVKNAIIKNIVISDFNISNTEYSAYLLSLFADNTVFDNITIMSSINGDLQIVFNAYNNTSFKHIANFSDKTIINDCDSCRVSESYSYGTFINNAYNANISNVYSRITLKDGMAGIIYNCDHSSIQNVYAINEIVLNQYSQNLIGNIIGLNDHCTAENVYFYDNEMPAVFYSKPLDGASAKTLDELKQKETFVGFDFDNIWKIDNGYPYLKNFHLINVTDINVKNKLNLLPNSTYNLTPVVSPNNATIKKLKYTSSNNEVVTVNSNGEVKSINNGTATITIETTDGSNISKSIEVKVYDNTIDYRNNEIVETYIKVPAFYTEEELIGSIKTNSTYITFEVVKKNNKVANGDSLLVYDDGELINTYTIIVIGDIDSNGSINQDDVNRAFNYLKGKVELSKEEQLALDVTNDGKVKINDVAKIYQYFKGKIESLGGGQ